MNLQETFTALPCGMLQLNVFSTDPTKRNDLRVGALHWLAPVIEGRWTPPVENCIVIHAYQKGNTIVNGSPRRALVHESRARGNCYCIWMSAVEPRHEQRWAIRSVENWSNVLPAYIARPGGRSSLCPFLFSSTCPCTGAVTLKYDQNQAPEITD